MSSDSTATNLQPNESKSANSSHHEADTDDRNYGRKRRKAAIDGELKRRTKTLT